MKHLVIGIAAFALAGSAQAALIEVDFSGSWASGSSTLGLSGNVVFDSMAAETAPGSDHFKLVSAALTATQTNPDHTVMPTLNLNDTTANNVSISQTFDHTEYLTFLFNSFYEVRLGTDLTFVDHQLPSDFSVVLATVGNLNGRDTNPTITIKDLTPPPPPPSVPEPTTWASLMFGFAAIGTAMRGRRAFANGAIGRG